MEEHNIKAIPTMYNEVQFRSRLEATWAAFFDLCEWEWDYEPIDLNGWIPDFILHGNDDVYIEVKPYKEAEEWNDVIDKIFNTGIEEQILLLGVSPFYFDDTYELSIGWTILDPLDYLSSAIFFYIKDIRKYDFSESSTFYDDRTGIMYNCNCFYHNSDPMPLWKKAKNITQWKKF